MGERRISFEKDKSDIIKRLLASDETSGPFKLIADVLVFAAAFGVKRNKRIPLGQSVAEPIRQDVFDRQGYDTMMNLIALHSDQRPQILADSDLEIDRRVTIFEEYANGGLELLREELKGAVNTLETTLLLINNERVKRDTSQDGFDLAKLVD